jgi:hypothetical protein
MSAASIKQCDQIDRMFDVGLLASESSWFSETDDIYVGG